MRRVQVESLKSLRGGKAVQRSKIKAHGKILQDDSHVVRTRFSTALRRWPDTYPSHALPVGFCHYRGTGTGTGNSVGIRYLWILFRVHPICPLSHQTVRKKTVLLMVSLQPKIL